MKTKLQRSLSEMSTFNEVQIHYERPIFNTNRVVKCSEDSERILREFLDNKRIDYKEFFWILLLTNANQILGVSEIGIGNTTGVAVNVKEIYQLALLSNASAVVVAHNHPSGKLKPSTADKVLTQKLKEAFKLLDITLLDHLILTSEGFVSFSDSGLM
ncbi:RadC family protein [uncultured Polaribacter sp.]|uniref:JAB domain-containing protein n=1 Tax=uncultured Polaribacter sp. TaxID=174711 RepID=UPI0026173A1B|nr:JAB domain-containing protein [uncultured Polaribacter sp.]